MNSHLLEQPAHCIDPVYEPNSVLIVDDDDAQVDILSRRLHKQGFNISVADTGELGLSLARQKRPSLILLDLRLPDTDGFDVCRKLSDSADTCGIPVIILSGMEQPDIIRRSRAAGCEYFVRKPYDPNALLLLIQQAIHDAAQW